MGLKSLDFLNTTRRFHMRARYLYIAVAVLAFANVPATHAQTPYVGEIRFVSFNFAPKGWAQCNGQLLPINQYQPLFNLIGTTYGGDGVTTFALPNLMGRVPIHEGDGNIIGQSGGQSSVVLTVHQLPSHHHDILGSDSPATSNTPGAHTLAGNSTVPMYNADAPNIKLHSNSTSFAGGGEPVPIMPPYLTLNCVIALEGIFPTPN
jgi:microcystin-dependent protein